jgi:hypothetical protein
LLQASHIHSCQWFTVVGVKPFLVIKQLVGSILNPFSSKTVELFVDKCEAFLGEKMFGGT